MNARLDNCAGPVNSNTPEGNVSEANVKESKPIEGIFPNGSNFQQDNNRIDPSFVKKLEESGPEILLDREKVMIAREVLKNIPYGGDLLEKFDNAVKNVNDSTFCNSYLGMLNDLEEEEYVRRFCEYAKGLSKEKYDEFISAVKKCFYNYREIGIDTDSYFERVFYNIEKSTEYPYVSMNDEQICNYLQASVYSILVLHATKGGNDFGSNIRNAIGAIFANCDLFQDTLQNISEMILKCHNQIFDEGFLIKTPSDKLLGDLYRAVNLYKKGNYNRASFILKKDVLQLAETNEYDNPISDYAHSLYRKALGPY